MKHPIHWLILAGFLLAAAWPRPAYAQAQPEDQIVLAENVTLEGGQVQDGSLVVIAGNVTLKEGSRLNGDVVLLGGIAEVNGEVRGSLVAFGGRASVGRAAVVTGDIILLGAPLTREAGAQIQGQVIQGLQEPLRIRLPEFSLPSLRGATPPIEIGLRPLIDAFWFLFRTFMVAALAVLLVMFFPRPAEITGQAAAAQPVVSGLVGLLTMVVLPVILIVMAVTILLIPISLVGFLALGVVTFLGWIALGLELGKRLAAAFKQEWAPAVSAGVGTFFLSLVTGGVNALVPCVGWMAPLIASAIGLGAVLVTGFGFQPVERGRPPAAPLPPAAPEPPGA